MNAVEFRTKLQESLRPEYLNRLSDYLELVESKGSIEDKRKALEFIGKIVEAVPSTDQAQRIYPMVNITFGAAGAMQVDAKPAPAQLVEEIPVPTLELGVKQNTPPTPTISTIPVLNALDAL